jgi:hypothetical protein
MSLATLLDRNKAFAATDAVAKNPKIPWLPNQLSYIITCIDSRAEPAAILGVGLGDATVQRTVGGRVTPHPRQEALSRQILRAAAQRPASYSPGRSPPASHRRGRAQSQGTGALDSPGPQVRAQLCVQALDMGPGRVR